MVEVKIVGEKIQRITEKQKLITVDEKDQMMRCERYLCYLANYWHGWKEEIMVARIFHTFSTEN